MGISEGMLKGVQVKSINDEVFTGSLKNSARYAAPATAFVQVQEDTQSPPLTTILLLDFLLSYWVRCPSVILVSILVHCCLQQCHRYDFSCVINNANASRFRKSIYYRWFHSHSLCFSFLSPTKCRTLPPLCAREAGRKTTIPPCPPMILQPLWPLLASLSQNGITGWPLPF